jgi:hypothetical protein
MRVSRRAIVFAGTESGRSCVDLRATFGDEYRVEHEESHEAESPDFRAQESAWLSVIPCRHGCIYPHGGRTLAAFTSSRGCAERLQALPGVRVHQDGQAGRARELTVLFDVGDFDRVAAVLEPKRRRRLSEAHKAKLVAAAKPHWFAGSNRGQRGSETHPAA